MKRFTKSIKYSEKEWVQVERRARAADLPPATFVREVSTGERGSDSFKTRHLLLRIGLHLKDLKQRFGEAGYEHDSQAVGRVLDQLRQALAAVDGYRYADEEAP